MTEQSEEKVLELDPEQLDELLSVSDKLPPIELDLGEFNQKDFKQGILDSSYAAGVITALLNTGVSESFVLDYLLSKESVEHNLKVAQINKEMNIEISKNHKVTNDKLEL